MIAHATANETALRLTGRDYLSWSAISTYRSCPLKFYFKYVAGLPERLVSASLVFGGALHAAIELHFRELLAGNPPPHSDALLEAFWEEWRSRSDMQVSFGKGENLNSMGRLADRMLRAFQASEQAVQHGQILGIEEELRGELIAGTPDLLAKLDLIVEQDDALVITDFKSARSRWSPEQAEGAGEQLLLYADLAQQLAPHKRLRLQFVIISKAKSPSVEQREVTVDRGRVQRMQQVAKRVWRAIEAEHFYPAPSPMNCPSCPFAGPCREWER